MKGLLEYFLKFAIGATVLGVTCSAYEHWHRKVYHEGYEFGKRMTNDYALNHAITGKPWTIKLDDDSEFTVTVKVEEVKD